MTLDKILNPDKYVPTSLVDEVRKDLYLIKAVLLDGRGRGVSRTYSASLTTTTKTFDFTGDPIMSFNIANDGTGQVQLRVNDEAESLPVLINNAENWDVDYKHHVVTKLFLRTTTGTADIRLAVSW